MLRASIAVVALVSACYAAHAAAPEPAAARGNAQPAAGGARASESAAPAPAPLATTRTSDVSSEPPLQPSLAPLGAGGAGAAQASPVARCPAEMALVERPQDAFCIDRWEASLERRKPSGERAPWPGNRVITGNGTAREGELVAVSVAGRMPQGYVSGAQAERACSNAGKRLCELDEWTRACRGPRGYQYPYGEQRRAGVCNDRFDRLDAHPVTRLFEQVAPKGTPRASMWEPYFMNDPRLHELPASVEPTGARAECRSEAGVYDLVGNLHEWVADPDGTFVGGFFMDTFQNGEGCAYRTTAHRRDYHDYSTGFRCCQDAAAAQ